MIKPFRINFIEFLTLFQLFDFFCLNNTDIFLVLCLSMQFSCYFIHQVLPELFSGNSIIPHILDNKWKVEEKFIKVWLLSNKILIIMINQIYYFMWRQSDAVKFIEIVEYRYKLTYWEDFACCFLCFHHQLFFYLESIFWCEGTGIADAL